MEIQDIKNQLDCKIGQLEYDKMNSKRFGVCFDKVDVESLQLLKEYRKILDRILLQNSNISTTTTVESVVTIKNFLNIDTNDYKKTVQTQNIGNCIKKIITKMPYFIEGNPMIQYSITCKYEQDLVDCTNPYTEIDCMDKTLDNIKMIL